MAAAALKPVIRALLILLLLLVCSMIGWVAAWLATVQHLRHFTPD